MWKSALKQCLRIQKEIPMANVHTSKFAFLATALILAATISVGQTQLAQIANNRNTTHQSAQAGIRDDSAFVFKINYTLQPFEDKDDYGKLLNALNGFLKTKNQSDTSNPYWIPSDFKANPTPYRDLFWAEYDRKTKNPIFFKPLLLEIIPTRLGGQYIVKLAYVGPDTAKLGTLKFICNIVAVKQDNGEYKFRSALGFNAESWHKKIVGTITFVYHDSLNNELAQKTNQFNIDLARKFVTKPLPITYHKCENPVEIFHLKGFDYSPWMYVDTTGGRLEDEGLLAGNNSEWYPHEIVHCYTGTVFERRSRFIDEGCATYLGGSGGQSLAEILKITSTFYKSNPNRDILDDLQNEYRIGRDLSVVYPLGGLICKLADEKFGFDGILRLLREDDFYKAVDKVLGVSKENLAEFFKRELSKYE